MWDNEERTQIKMLMLDAGIGRKERAHAESEWKGRSRTMCFSRFPVRKG